jgi:hypothetical protein
MRKNILIFGVMKNKIVFFSFVICFSFQILNCKAQFIDNKINISASYNIGVFHGDKQVHDRNFIFPAFYSNLSNIKVASIKALYKGHQNISYGITLSQSFASDWNYKNEEFYLDSKAEMQSLAATIQLHNKFSPHGIFNRCKFYLEISPTIGLSTFSSSNELFVVHGTDNITTPVTSNDFYYGFNGSTGIECAFTQAIGMLISYSLQYNRVQSILYSDDHFTASQLNVGFLIKLKKDKRYLYRN